MSRRISFFLALAMLFAAIPASSAAEFYEVKFRVLNSDGSPSRGQSVTTATWGERLTDAGGEVAFELPAGQRKFDFVFWPESNVFNLGAVQSSSTLTITGNKTWEIRLPEVIHTKLRVEDSRGKPLNFVGGININWLCKNIFKPQLGGSNESSFPLTPIYTLQEPDGRRLQQRLGLFRGSPLRGDEGVFEIALFHWAQGEGDTCSLDAGQRPNSLQVGVEPTSVIEFTENEFLSGALRLQSSEVVTVNTQVKPDTITNSGTNISFTLEGTFETPTPQYLELLKSVTVVGAPRGVTSVGSQIASDRFSVKVNINLAQASPVVLFVVGTLTSGLRVGLGFVELPAGAGPISVRAWTKDMGSGKINLYARNLINTGKVRFLHNGKEIAWVRASSEGDRKLRSSPFGPYLVRSVTLVPGRNVLEIYVDSTRVARRIANT